MLDRTVYFYNFPVIGLLKGDRHMKMVLEEYGEAILYGLLSGAFIGLFIYLFALFSIC